MGIISTVLVTGPGQYGSMLLIAYRQESTMLLIEPKRQHTS